MYYKGKWCTAGGKDPLFGHVDGFQIDPKYFYGKDFSIIVDEAANDRIDSRLRKDFIARGDSAPAPLQSMRSRGNTGQNGRPACLYFSCVEISCCHFELFEIPERTVC